MKILKSLQQETERHFIERRNEYPAETYFSGCLHFGKYLVDYWVSANGKDIEISNPEKDRYYDNVADWLCDHTINFQDIEIEETDEWDCHGFRDEQDFINYKYG